MSNFYYLDVQLKLRDEAGVVLTPVYFQGSIEASLNSLYGDIGGQTELELLKFDSEQKRGILRVPEEYYNRTRSAITLIGHFQDIPCHFLVHKASKEQIDF